MDLQAQFRAALVPSHQISQPQCLVEWYSVGRDPSLLFRSACPHHSYSFDFGFSNKKSRSFRCDWLHAVIALYRLGHSVQIASSIKPASLQKARLRSLPRLPQSFVLRPHH
ncbi:hypothetical protein PCASD_03692 [Puccinia coronata f. sp. avenae]|uniref:Uncharacterized protein n=1 Tax=Puccinia coronata f. sp. avenae TaxID=200324 RepID=A0A2N5V9N9_9BASI|nr:hypothetical protein PCASD_03692 [Puccinia coronata f. sp. avenae]